MWSWAEPTDRKKPACLPQAIPKFPLTHQPFRLGTLYSYLKSPHANQEETMPFGVAQNPQTGRNLQASLRPPPTLEVPMASNPQPNALYDTRPQLSPPEDNA